MMMNETQRVRLLAQWEAMQAESKENRIRNLQSEIRDLEYEQDCAESIFDANAYQSKINTLASELSELGGEYPM